MTDTTSRTAGLNVLLGLWLVVAPFLLTTTTAGLWNDVLMGLGIATFAGYNYYRTTQGTEVSLGSSATVAIIGVWLIFAPFVLGGITGAALLNDVTVGVVVALTGTYNAYVANGETGGEETKPHGV